MLSKFRLQCIGKLCTILTPLKFINSVQMFGDQVTVHQLEVKIKAKKRINKISHQ